MTKTDNNEFILTSKEASFCAYALRMYVFRCASIMMDNHSDKQAKQRAMKEVETCHTILNQLDPISED